MGAARTVHTEPAVLDGEKEVLDASSGICIDPVRPEALHFRLHIGDDLHPVLKRKLCIAGDNHVRPVGTPEDALNLDDPVAFTETVKQPPAADDSADDAAVRRGAIICGMPHARKDKVGV